MPDYYAGVLVRRNPRPPRVGDIVELNVGLAELLGERELLRVSRTPWTVIQCSPCGGCTFPHGCSGRYTLRNSADDYVTRSSCFGYGEQGYLFILRDDPTLAKKLRDNGVGDMIHNKKNSKKKSRWRPITPTWRT